MSSKTPGRRGFCCRWRPASSAAASEPPGSHTRLLEAPPPLGEPGGPLPQNGTASPASRSRSRAMPMHSATEAPSALIPPSSGPPEAANVHAG
ncbi:hypothetical protein GKQ77_17785 [Streptomyces sp. BG9H]|uniref:Uncharacterized protein n=1 Tax=Streptomyces anatolicus TaxID=2675858 RepID=A0ABS6YPN7_9ACTN|nr:hypothetical protein [Streptomyces anatolicus]